MLISNWQRTGADANNHGCIKGINYEKRNVYMLYFTPLQTQKNHFHQAEEKCVSLIFFPSINQCFHCRSLVNIWFNQQKKYNLPIFMKLLPRFIEIEMWNAYIFHLRGFAVEVTTQCTDQNRFHQCRQMKCKHNQISLAHTTILCSNANLRSPHYVSDEKS